MLQERGRLTSKIRGTRRAFQLNNRYVFSISMCPVLHEIYQKSIRRWSAIEVLTGRSAFLFAKSDNPRRKYVVIPVPPRWPRRVLGEATEPTGRFVQPLLAEADSVMPAPTGQGPLPRSLGPSIPDPPPSSETLASVEQCPLHRNLL